MSDLLDELLLEPYRLLDPVVSDAEGNWCNTHGNLPNENLRKIQRVWESNEIENKIAAINESLSKNHDKARILANSICESGAWLQALPSPQLGTHLSNEEFRIAVSLRLGSPIVQPHICICGDRVTKYAHHGLSCSKAKGTRSRHASVNDLIHRALKSAEIPSILEPPGCSRPDGKKPDGMSLVPWARGRSLLWDFTCVDTFAPSYLNSTSRHVGSASRKAEREKITKYNDLLNQFIFVPVATKTSGVIGKVGLELIQKIGSKIADVTNENKSTSYLIQRISVAIQKGNAASILGTIQESKNLSEIFYI